MIVARPSTISTSWTGRRGGAAARLGATEIFVTMLMAGYLPTLHPINRRRPAVRTRLRMREVGLEDEPLEI